jgi:hypothetical protein
MKAKTCFRLALIFAGAAAAPAMAAESEKYPAHDFKPSVVYSNPDLIGQATAAPAQPADPKYPAAYFTPTVIQSALPRQAEAHQPDPKYPAAYFTPSVVYPGPAR